MIEFSTCKNCNRPIFFDWMGAHHIKQYEALSISKHFGSDIRLDFSKPECDRPEEVSEE